MKLINEDRKTSYGCVMLFFDFPNMYKVQDAIDPDDVYEDPDDDSFGFEDEPHVTLLYGLHDEVTDEEVKGVLDKFEFKPITLSKLSLFDNPDYDVLKFDIGNDGGGHILYEVNKELKKFPFTSDYPDYHPHSTVAYLKPKTGKKWVEKIDAKGFEVTPKFAVYSKPNEKKSKFKIRISQ